MCDQEIEKLHAQLHHAGYDLSEAKAEHRLALESIVSLLNDALDAIEIDALETAKRRIERVIETSNSQIKRLMP